MGLDERKDLPCNNFDSLGGLVCRNCGWTEGSHHVWYKYHPLPSLGPGWACSRCHRSAYVKDGRCTIDEPPTDYPLCSSWVSTTDTD